MLWELARLVKLGRLDLDLDDREVVRILSRLHVWPLDLSVARASTRLDFSGDPADELIAATSVVHNVPLLTRDQVMRSSKIVPLALQALRMYRGAEPGVALCALQPAS